MKKAIGPWLPAARALFWRGAGTVIYLLLFLGLARFWGPRDVGIYAVYVAWVAAGSLIVGMGTATHTLRHVALAIQRGRHGNVWRTIVGNILWVCGAYVAFGAGILLTTTFIPPASFVPDFGFIFIVAALIGILSVAISKVFIEALKASGAVYPAIAYESIVIPGVVLLVISGAWAFGYKLPILNVIIIQIIGTSLAGLGALAHLRPRIAGIVKDGESGILEDDSIAATERPMRYWPALLLGAIQTQLPLVVLPVFVSEEEVGIFAVAYRLVSIVIMGMVAIASLYAPLLARAHARAADATHLRRLLGESRRVGLVFLGPYLVALMFVPGLVLRMAGPSYSAGAALLGTMATAYLIYPLAGSAGTLLSMTGHQHLETLSAALAVGVLLAFAAAAMPLLGITGMAMAAAASAITRQGLSIGFARRILATGA